MTLGRHERRANDHRNGNRRAELHGLLGLSKQLLSAADPQAAAAALLESVVGLYGFPRALLVSAQGDRLTVFSTHGMSAAVPRGPQTSDAVSQAVMGSATSRLRRVDEASEPWLAQLFPGEVDVLVVPVAAADGWPGALLVQLPLLRPRHWRSTAVEPLEWALSAAAQALRGLARLERAERMAATDGLTNIATARRSPPRWSASWRAAAAAVSRSAW